MNRDEEILKPFLIKELSQMGLYNDDWLKSASGTTLYILAKQYDYIITNWLNSKEYIEYHKYDKKEPSEEVCEYDNPHCDCKEHENTDKKYDEKELMFMKGYLYANKYGLLFLNSMTDEEIVHKFTDVQSDTHSDDDYSRNVDDRIRWLTIELMENDIMVGEETTLIDLEFNIYDISYKTYRVYLDKFHLFNYIDIADLISPEFLMGYIAKKTDKDFHRLTSKTNIALMKMCIDTQDFREYLRNNTGNVIRTSRELYYDSLYSLRNELLSSGFDFRINELNGDDSRSVDFLLKFAKENRTDLYNKYTYIFNDLEYSENTNYNDVGETDIEDRCVCLGINKSDEYARDIDLKSISTKRLYDELLTRGGIESVFLNPEDSYKVELHTSDTVHNKVTYEGNGPLFIIFNYD